MRTTKTLNIKPHHKAITVYYDALERYHQHGVTHETAVRAAFQALLEVCARQKNWTLVCEYTLRLPAGSRGTGPRAAGKHSTLIRLDGALLDAYNLPCGTWEAKGIQSNLATEARRKFDAGYPQDNILFQTPERAMLYQHGALVLDEDITSSENLVAILKRFFAYEREHAAEWEAAVTEFRDIVPALKREAAELIQAQHRTSARFQTAFANFHRLCQAAINPNLSEAAVKEMLIQHLLTERTFRTVFGNPDFTQRNIIAREIEKVIRALTEDAFSRDEFLKNLNPFYQAIEREAVTLVDFSQKQHFLNTVYEQFFQGDSAEVADTHGIVYTPQPIVDFMVKSVDYLLQTEFERSLSESGVHIIDPFVGTGNFIVRLMHEIDRFQLEAKYRSELWCNEVLLLPYYIASINIEHEFYAAIGKYLPFEGISLVDTFDLAEARQLSLLTQENTARVERQKASPMFVIIGNPPYNIGQKNENDNNKNRKYPTMDKRVRETYSRDSAAASKKALGDLYVKAIRWASDRIGEAGIIAFVTNHSFLEGISFDGMRKHLAADFDALYVVDLGGNVRQGQPGDANVFGIQCGVCITLFVKRKQATPKSPRLLYNGETRLQNKSRTFEFLEKCQHVGNVTWQQIQPDARHTWITSGLHSEFGTFVPIGIKKARKETDASVPAIFHKFGLGLQTARDAWLYNFNHDTLVQNVKATIDTYNAQVFGWERRTNQNISVDDFVLDDGTKIKWSSGLKRKLMSGQTAEFADEKIRQAIYRPFTKTNLFFDRTLNHIVSVFPSTFPTPATETENQVIWLKTGRAWPMFALMVNKIPDILPQGASQCFPFYVYDEDGTNHRENITDWALQNFRAHYGDDAITKWDIFNYTYGILHHPEYRQRYAADLKRDLPHIPYAEDFWAFANAGAQLAEIHVNYEAQPQYPLTFITKPDAPLNLRVEKMQLSKDRTQLKYNEFLTLAGIPAAAFAYRLGNRSALDWLIDGYQVKTDDRSQLVNDANNAAKPRYIVELIGSVITVSLKTQEIVAGLPEMFRGP